MSGSALFDLLIVAVPLAAVLWWWQSSRVRELAIGHARAACLSRGFQFLDQSVALRRLRSHRGKGGAMTFRREFAFEFTEQGAQRDGGTVVMSGQTLVKVEFPYITDAEGSRIWLQ